MDIIFFFKFFFFLFFLNIKKNKIDIKEVTIVKTCNPKF